MKIEDMTFEWVSGHQIKPYSTIGFFRNRKYKKLMYYYDKYHMDFYRIKSVSPRKLEYISDTTIRKLQLAAFPEDVPWWYDDATHWRHTNV